MRQIGIKLADGTFYPVLDEGEPKKRQLDLTTVKDNQTKVQVDLYRSESGTMEDAEYVDTLEVTKLNPHPNGELDLHLSLGLDENNELSAEVVDDETGKKSETKVSLVTRTLAERENSEPDFNLGSAVDPSEAENASFADTASEVSDGADAVDDAPTAADADTAGAGESADTASPEAPALDPNEPFSFATAPEPTTTSDDDLPLPDFDSLLKNADDAITAADAISPDAQPDAIPLADAVDADELSAAASESDATVSEGATIEAPASEADSAPFDLPDFDSFDATASAPSDDTAENSAEEPVAAEAPASDGSEADDTNGFDLPDFDSFDDTALTVADESAPAPESTPAADDSADATVSDDGAAAASGFDLPDFDSFEAATTAPAAESAAEAPALDMPDFNEPLETGIKDAITPEKDDFALPDFDSLEDTAQKADATASDSALDLPDFDTTLPEAAATASTDTDFDVKSLDLPDFSDLNTPTPSAHEFDLPDFDNPATNTELNFDDPAFDDPIFGSPNTSSSGSSAGGLMDFSDLYDKETLEGGASYKEEEKETKHKTGIPVIICVICAVICTLATLFVLFVIPSRYNLLSSRKTTEIAAVSANDSNVTLPLANATEANGDAETQSAAKTAPVQPIPVAPARENVIVVAPNAEAVVPTPTVTPAPVVQPKKATGDVTYHIKWGDTLWDISDAYYNNPWKYPKIADYNHIKNPDLIISGTDIKIPKE